MAKNQNQPFLGVIKTPPVKNEHVLILPSLYPELRSYSAIIPLLKKNHKNYKNQRSVAKSNNIVISLFQKFKFGSRDFELPKL